jgi:hypothetical protein
MEKSDRPKQRVSILTRSICHQVVRKAAVDVVGGELSSQRQRVDGKVREPDTISKTAGICPCSVDNYLTAEF